jgi:hypothetical protein
MNTGDGLLRPTGLQFLDPAGRGPPGQHAIELVRRLKDPRVKLIVSHPAGDEGSSYMRLLRERIDDAHIDVRFIADRIADVRGRNAEGKKLFTLFDVYPHADLVTYPSLYEGFGNAFLEAIYFRKPVVVNTYAVYARDLADNLGLGLSLGAFVLLAGDGIVRWRRRGSVSVVAETAEAVPPGRRWGGLIPALLLLSLAAARFLAG